MRITLGYFVAWFMLLVLGHIGAQDSQARVSFLQQVLGESRWGMGIEYAQWNFVFDEELWGDSQSTRDPYVLAELYGENIRLGPLTGHFRVATDGLQGDLVINPRVLEAVASQGLLRLKGVLGLDLPGLAVRASRLALDEIFGWAEDFDLVPRLSLEATNRTFRWNISKGPAFGGFWNETLTWIDGEGGIQVLTNADKVTHESIQNELALVLTYGPLGLGIHRGSYTSPNEVFIIWPAGDGVQIPQVAQNILVVMDQVSTALLARLDVVKIFAPTSKAIVAMDTLVGAVRPESKALVMDDELFLRLDAKGYVPLNLGAGLSLEVGANWSWLLINADSLEDHAVVRNSFSLGGFTIPKGNAVDASFFRGDIWWGFWLNLHYQVSW